MVDAFGVYLSSILCMSCKSDLSVSLTYFVKLGDLILQ